MTWAHLYIWDICYHFFTGILIAGEYPVIVSVRHRDTQAASDNSEDGFELPL